MNYYKHTSSLVPRSTYPFFIRFADLGACIQYQGWERFECKFLSLWIWWKIVYWSIYYFSSDSQTEEPACTPFAPSLLLLFLVHCLPFFPLLNFSSPSILLSLASLILSTFPFPILNLLSPLPGCVGDHLTTCVQMRSWKRNSVNWEGVEEKLKVDCKGGRGRMAEERGERREGGKKSDYATASNLLLSLKKDPLLTFVKIALLATQACHELYSLAYTQENHGQILHLVWHYVHTCIIGFFSTLHSTLQCWACVTQYKVANT